MDSFDSFDSIDSMDFVGFDVVLSEERDRRREGRVGVV